MARPDIKPLEVLDESTKLVETETLGGRGVHQLRILSESRFLDVVSHLVDDYLKAFFGSVDHEAEEDDAPHDRKLSREYQRRWEALRTKHDISLRQIERRIDRLGRVFSRLESVLTKVDASRVPAVEVHERGASVDKASADKKLLMREMLLGVDSQRSDSP